MASQEGIPLKHSGNFHSDQQYYHSLEELRSLWSPGDREIIFQTRRNLGILSSLPKGQRRFHPKARRSALPPTPIHLSHQNQKQMQAPSSRGRNDLFPCQRRRDAETDTGTAHVCAVSPVSTYIYSKQGSLQKRNTSRPHHHWLGLVEIGPMVSYTWIRSFLFSHMMV